MSSLSFKSCPRVGGIEALLRAILELIVSSRAPVWGASLAEENAAGGAAFQVVPPCGGHPAALCRKDLAQLFQVVPPCGGHPVDD